ncbi:zinc protease [Achromatium sp. WMS2]|nr:zinc protease [Achromatium sp. WMS2]
MLFVNYLIRISILLLLAATSASGIAAVDIQTWKTDNGAKVLFVAAPDLPMLDIRIVFNAGSARETLPGQAYLTNSILAEGAGNWNVEQIAERLESVGSNLNSGSLRDMAWLGLRTLTLQPALDTSLETMATILTSPSFPAASLERLRNLTLVKIHKSEQQPNEIGSKAFYQILYGDHPYAHDPAGTPETITAITRQQLIDYFQQYYVASNAVVAIVGAVDRATAERIAAQVTSGLATGQAAPALSEVTALPSSTVKHINFPTAQSHIYTGQPGVTREDPDFFPLYVGNHVLGGNGLVSILGLEVREARGLSYSVYSYFIPMQRPGPFVMGLQTQNSQAENALDVLMQTLRKFSQTGPTPKQLEEAKRNITGGFPLRIASNGKIIENLSMIGFYNLPLDYLDTFNAKVAAVTVEQVRDAFQRRVKPDNFATVIVGGNSRVMTESH